MFYETDNVDFEIQSKKDGKSHDLWLEVKRYILKAIFRRWAGKTSYVHLAHEYEYRAKHLAKAHKN